MIEGKEKNTDWLFEHSWPTFQLFQVHLLPTDIPSSLEDSKKPVADHSSQIKTKAACNCGRVQADKDDPFDHKVTLYMFTGCNPLKNDGKRN